MESPTRSGLALPSVAKISPTGSLPVTSSHTSRPRNRSVPPARRSQAEMGVWDRGPGVWGSVSGGEASEVKPNPGLLAITNVSTGRFRPLPGRFRSLVRSLAVLEAHGGYLLGDEAEEEDEKAAEDE